MALEIRQNLKLSQQPIMTPQLQQLDRLLELGGHDGLLGQFETLPDF